MTLLKKLTAVLNQDLMRECFNLRENYDFVLDPQSKKKKTAQKEYKQFLTREVRNNRIYATQYLINNAYRIINKDIPDIFDHINKTAGYSHISYKAANMTGKSHPVFDIVDGDFLKQQQIKELRATNKAASSGYSKKDITNKVWKYRYLPPALESEYFERNTGGNKELTKIRQVEIIPPYTRGKYTKLPPTNNVGPNFQSPYLVENKYLNNEILKPQPSNTLLKNNPTYQLSQVETKPEIQEVDLSSQVERQKEMMKKLMERKQSFQK
jgi:hypothetical protein